MGRPKVHPHCPSPEKNNKIISTRLVGQLDQVRALARRRRLRFQLPLALAGLTIGGAGVIGGFAANATLLGGLGMALGPWLLLLCVLPSDARGIVLSLACTASGCWITSVYHLVPLVLLGGRCPPPHSARGCALFTGLTSYAVVLLGLHAAYASYLALALVGELTRTMRWLPRAPARASLTGAWRCVGSVLFWYAPMYLAFGLYELHERLGDLFFFNAREADFAPPAAIRFASAALMATLGSLALWPRFRAVVQARLLSMGEGVAAAAAIAELLGPDETAAVLAYAEATFRVVRADQLLRSDFDTNEPAAASFARSAPARLGGCDIFLSHSWLDDPSEKWRLLQAWRANFGLLHGREPNIWFDRCCIDPGNVTSLLPCLPIYLAGCDKMLALRGPSYLRRLWCVIEMFVFFEMKADASRIEIFSFASDSLQAFRPPARDDADGGARRDTACLPFCSWTEIERRRSVTLVHDESDDALHFDVRAATCALESDNDRLLSAVETVGGGFEAFNIWMRALLEKSRRAQVARAAAPRTRATI